MLLINGEILPSDAIRDILPTLNKRICKTLQKPLLDPMLVVEACHKLAIRIEHGDYSDYLQAFITEQHINTRQLQQAVHLLKRDSLLYKLKTELGDYYYNKEIEENHFTKRRMPLGVLFHIAAGNVDALPAYSVIEGLLAGNINILKLPAADKAFTVHLLSELIKADHRLADYIYVFDSASGDTAQLKAMAGCADAVVVWGGDEAIHSVRQLAPANTKIIEWGHKLSFVYITAQGMEEERLKLLARHILSTKQLLCSSCQGIYIDTADPSVLDDFCRSFLPVLEEEASAYPAYPIEMQAQLTLLQYTRELEAATGDMHIFRGERCSLTVSSDRRLESSLTHGNCWVKALAQNRIISSLHRYKSYLQTAGLLCSMQEREPLSQLLCRAGVTRVIYSGDMSQMRRGEAHDGEYPLLRYSKIVEY